MDKYTANRYIWLKQQIAAGNVPHELIDEVDALNETVNGDETQEPPVVGLVDVVGDLEEAVEDLDIDINGDDTTEPPTPGLKDRVSDLETTINGDSSVSPAIPPLLAGAGNVRLSTLWSNSDTTQEFSSGNIALASDNYDYLIVIFNYSTSSGATSSIAPKGDNISLSITNATSSAGAVTFSRLLTYVSGDSLSAGDAYRAIASTAGEVNNYYVIPSIILGVKIMSN